MSELFDKMVVPILLFGCEVWGFEKLDSIERVHLKFLNHILCLKNEYSKLYGIRKKRVVLLYL